MKTCIRCALPKTMEEFPRHVRNKDGRGSACKPCDALRGRQLRAAAPKTTLKALQLKAREGWTPEQRKAAKTLRKRAWHMKHKAREVARMSAWRAANRDEHRALVKAWRDSHPAECRAHETARKAAKLQAMPAWADLESIKDVYAEARHFSMHVDHIVPLQSPMVCGLHVWDNLQLLAPFENIAKGNRHWPDMPGTL